MTLDSISRATAPLQAVSEPLVVANVCSDSTGSILKRLAVEQIPNSLPVRFLIEPQPGKSFALNRAIAETDPETLCFIDVDQLVEKGLLEALPQAIAGYPNHEIICGKIQPGWDGSEPAWVHDAGPYQIRIRPFPEFDLGNDSKDIHPKVTYYFRSPSGLLVKQGNLLFSQSKRSSRETINRA